MREHSQQSFPQTPTFITRPQRLPHLSRRTTPKSNTQLFKTRSQVPGCCQYLYEDALNANVVCRIPALYYLAAFQYLLSYPTYSLQSNRDVQHRDLPETTRLRYR